MKAVWNFAVILSLSILFVDIVNAQITLVTVYESSTPSRRLKNGPSLRYKLENWSPQNIAQVKNYSNAESLDTIEELCKNSVTEAKLLTDAILTTVSYYENHLDDINTYDATVGLKILQEVLEHIFKRRGENMQIALINRTIPLIEQIIKENLKVIDDPADKEALTTFSHEHSLFSRCFPTWKSPGELHSRKWFYSKLAQDSETIWPQLNLQCQAAVVRDCDVPYSCERTFLNPEPQSQYMLTHQALYLLFAEQKSCTLEHPEIFQGWEHRLEVQCGKMLKEAEFMAEHGYPDWGRDLFAEYVFICGLAGYPNFLRSEWINEILSWQSSSDFGCFVNPGMEKYTSTEIKIKRKQTPDEVEANIQTDEICLVHQTSTALAALAVKLGWLHDKCLPYGAEYDIMMQEEAAIQAERIH